MDAFLTIVLILLSLFLVLLILLQRSSGGMGSALGGGAADQVFGGGSAAVLTKWTVWGVLGFFLIAFGLHLLNQSKSSVAQPVVTPNTSLSTPTPTPPPDGNGTKPTPPITIPLAPNSDANASKLGAPVTPGSEGGD
ncbi:MAG: preprotein translocase subunit SecG [Opitutales bacterium]|jgi:protein translocase SecG subunit